MGDRPWPARTAVARDSRAARRPGLRNRHGPGAIGYRTRHQGPHDGTGVAGGRRRRSCAPRQREGTAPPGYSALTGTSGAPPANNFPPLINRLIGRAAAAQFVRDLVSAYRVVTLTGPGGIGKTSLAIKAVRYLLPDFEDGGWIVELASLSDPGLVPSTVASTLGLKLAGEISAESVARAVGGRHLVLVLDNCEHVIDAVANRAEPFTPFVPRPTIVATSREVLRIDGESVYRVPPLDVPAPGQAAPDYILQYSAVELFVARHKALNAGFSAQAEDLASIATICRHLDGIPLAIEFAAARAAVLSVQGVAAGLRDRFALLTAGRRTALPRQRALRATLDWSHELLPETERRWLRRLAVFPAGFTADAAAAVMTDTGFDASAVLDGIANLVAKSWVTLDKIGWRRPLDSAGNDPSLRAREACRERRGRHRRAAPCIVFSRSLRTAGARCHIV